ncbi:MAG TPA: hypothetical protein VN618_12375 [Solirubrobacteraceae bacterium]|nr:hypothetical protein [Solirubrobacteraceae bacterium]
MALSSADVAELVQGADYDDASPAGTLGGRRTPQQRDDYRAAIEAELAANRREGDADGVAACDTELRRLESEPVADPPIPTPATMLRGREFDIDHAAREGGLLGPPPSPLRERTAAELADYRASIERERANYQRQGDAAGVAACDAELRNCDTRSLDDVFTCSRRTNGQRCIHVGDHRHRRRQDRGDARPSR